MTRPSSLRIEIRYEREIVVHPLLSGSAKSRLLLPDTLSSRRLEHIRTRRGQARNVFEFISQAHPEPAEQRLSGKVIYGGPFFAHFGHLIAESIHRIWPRLIYQEMASAKVAFHPTPRRNGYLKASEPWMKSVLCYMGIDESDIIMIDRPIVFEELIIPQQARGQCFPTIDPDYNKIFPLITWDRSDPVLQDQKKFIYVSRKHYLQSGTYLGEQLVESTLEKAGFLIVYPEEWSVNDLVKVFCEASAIVFSEGSAIHILELCGKISASVYIICRRNLEFVSTVFGQILSELTERYVLIKNDEIVTPLHWDHSKSIPSSGNACAIVDIEHLFKTLSDDLNIEIPVPSGRVIRQSQRDDLLEMILSTKSSSTDSSRLGELLSLLQSQFTNHHILVR